MTMSHCAWAAVIVATVLNAASEPALFGRV